MLHKDTLWQELLYYLPNNKKRPLHRIQAIQQAIHIPKLYTYNSHYFELALAAYKHIHTYNKTKQIPQDQHHKEVLRNYYVHNKNVQ